MISDPVRRRILSILAEEGNTTRSELAAMLATDESIPAANTESFEIRLHHDHLPRLADEQYIQYDARNGDIVLWKEPQWILARLQEN